MPTLDWIGKEAVLGHHRQVPFHLLHCDRELSVGDPGAGNLLIEGDNLLALKALLPHYAGKVKCIYIDPPYNTGNENWVYNDNVNSPEIREWLGKVVGPEAADLSRHDKWLCMMYPRLALLREFLTEDGLLFVSIDDNELARARLLCDEIFGRRCFLAVLVWKSRHFTDTRPLSGVSGDHEYILVYGGNPSARLRGKRKDFNKYKNPDNDTRGDWTSCSLLGKATRDQRPNLHYDFHDPVTGEVFPCPPRTGWICALETMERNAREGRLLYPKKKGGRLRLKVFRDELQSDFMGFPSVISEYATSDGTAELRELLGVQVFSFPKPSHEAGSGVEPKRIPGLAGGFRYCRLGEPLFDETGQVRDQVKFPDLAAHIFFTETGSPIPKRANGRTPLLGVHNGRAVYLLFNGVLGDRRPDGGNVLTREVLGRLPPHPGPRVVYGESCRLSPERLACEGIDFRHVPYHIEVR